MHDNDAKKERRYVKETAMRSKLCRPFYYGALALLAKKSQADDDMSFVRFRNANAAPCGLCSSLPHACYIEHCYV